MATDNDTTQGGRSLPAAPGSPRQSLVLAIIEGLAREIENAPGFIRYRDAARSGPLTRQIAARAGLEPPVVLRTAEQLEMHGLVTSYRRAGCSARWWPSANDKDQ